MAMNETKIVISADDRTGAAFKSVQNSLGSLKSAAAGLGAALSVGAFTGFIKSSIDAADALNDMSKTTGASVETLAGLQLAAKQSGTELEVVAKGMLKFSGVVLDAANGSKESAEKISALGLNLEKLKNQKPEDQLIALAGALEKFGSEKQGVIIADVLGNKMAVLAPLLSEGADGLTKMIDEGRKLNPITAGMAKNADAFNDELEKLKMHSGIVGISLANDLLPGLTNTALAMSKLQAEGHGVLALLRGLAGIGKLPFDLFTGKEDFSVGKQVKKLKQDLSDMQRHLPDVEHGGALQKWMYGSKDDLTRKIEVTKNQIANLEKFAGQIRPEPEVKKKTEADPSKYAIASTPKKSKEEKDALAIAKKQAKEYQESELWAAQSLNDQLGEAFATQTKWNQEAQETAQSFIDMIAPGDALVRQLQSVEFLMETINEKTGKPFLSADQGGFALLHINEQIDGLNKLEEKGKDTYAELKQAIDGWGKDAAGAMADFAITGKSSFSDMTKSILADLAKMAIYENITKPMFNYVGAAFGIAGARATGGPVSAGSAYLVGENGPEIMMPNASGTILPNSSLGGSTYNVAVSVDATGGKVAGDAGQASELGRKIESALRSVLIAEKRPGGMLA